MLNKYLYIFIVILTITSCTQNNKDEKRANSFAPKVVEAKGYIVPQDSMIEPEVIIIDESKLKRVVAGKPTIVPINTNIHIAGIPKMIRAGTPRVCIPGQDTFLLPKKILIIDSPFVAGIPDVVIAKDAVLKEDNPQNFSTFSKLQGLLGEYISYMLEDKNGNIWFATYGGVSKYDGKYFTQYTMKEGLCNSNINTMLEDREGNIWFGTRDGLSKYNGRTFINYSQKTGLIDNNIVDIAQDIEGNIWIGTYYRGVSKYDGKYFTNYSEKEGLSSSISKMAKDKNGNVWFATFGDGIIKYDAVNKIKTGKESFIHYTEKEGLPGIGASYIMEDNNENIWFCTEKGVSKFDGKHFISYSEKEGLPSNQILDILHDKSNIWFCTSMGVSKFDGKTFTNYTEKDGLNNNFVVKVLKDKQGNIWFGTFNNGVSKYDGKTFTNFTKEQGLSNDNILSILKDKNNNIWFGTDESGVSIYKPPLKPNRDNSLFSYYTEKEGLSSNRIRTMLEDKNGAIWFGTWGGGISKLVISGKHNENNKSFIYYTKEEGFGSDFVNDIIEDKKGNIWITYYDSSVYKYDGNIVDAIENGKSITNKQELKKINGRFVKSLTHYNKKTGLCSNDIVSVLEDKKGNIWFTSFGKGVTLYNPSARNGKGSFTHFNQNNGLSSNYTLQIMEDKYGNIWIGTYGGGVCRYDGKYFTHFNQKNGLADNAVSAMLEDKKGNLWFASQTGLSKLNKKLSGFSQSPDSYREKINSMRDDEVVFKNYKYEDGLLFSIESPSKMIEDANGTIWIGTSKKLIAFHPEEQLEDTVSPNIQLTNLKLYNEEISWSTIQNKKDSILILGNGMQVSNFEFEGLAKWYSMPQNLSLSYNNNYLTFNFIGITQKQNKKVKYKYFLEGNDANWSAATLKNEATYGNISPGTYTFKVKAMNSDGYWSNSYTYTFTIRPPWWKTWWAYLLYIISGLSILYIIYYLRTSTLRKTQILLEKKVEERTQELIATQNQLIQSEKLAAFGAVATRVAHEIQNPLNFVTNFSNLSEELVNEIMASDNEEGKKESAKLLIDNLQKINHHGKRADSIVKQLFKHTKDGTAHEYFEE